MFISVELARIIREVDTSGDLLNSIKASLLKHQEDLRLMDPLWLLLAHHEEYTVEWADRILVWYEENKEILK